MAIASADRFDPHGLKKTRMQLASAGARIARRTTSWDSPGFVFSFALVAAACVVLYRLLDDVDVFEDRGCAARNPDARHHHGVSPHRGELFHANVLWPSR